MLGARTPKTIGTAMIAIEVSPGRAAAGICVRSPFRVMAGLDPAIHVFLLGRSRLAARAIGETSDKGVDGRDKPGHDGAGRGDPRRTARPLIRPTTSATPGSLPGGRLFPRKGHGCPGKMSRVNQSVAAHAPQNKGTR